MDYPSNMVAALTAFPERTTKRAAMVAVLTAACVASNYALIGVVNVKFMDLIVFVAGFSLGPIVGASVGVLTWLVYGSLNPYGFSLPILVITSTGESLYGIVGGLLGRGSERVHRGVSDSAKFAVVGFLLTFVYLHRCVAAHLGCRPCDQERMRCLKLRESGSWSPRPSYAPR